MCVDSVANEFPPDWPADCPPANSLPANGMVYRLVQRRPLKPRDFRSWKELDVAPTREACDRCGISVARSIRGLLALRRRSKSLKVKKYIARATLDASHGRFSPHDSPDAHVNWWPFDGVDRTALFSIVGPVCQFAQGPTKTEIGHVGG